MPDKSEKISLKINPKVYSLDAVLGAAYSFLDRAYIFIGGNPEKSIKIFIKAKKETPGAAFRKIAGEFQNELLNQALRVSVARNNREIREYIVAGAVLGAVQKPDKVSPPSGASLAAGKAEKEENLGLDLEKDKDLLKELKKLEKEFSPAAGDFDFKKDKLGIAVPWEEKFGKNKKKK